MEGHAAWALLTRGGGQWIRAGMDGAVTGLDIESLLARPSARDCDAAVLELLLTMAEPAIVAKLNERRRER